MEKAVYIPEFTQFPRAVVGTQKVGSGLNFEHYLNHKSIKNVNSTRMEYFTQRLAQAEERVLSHTDVYMKAKLSKSEADAQYRVVHNVHSVLGSEERKWVIGILTQKEDGMYYLEDTTLSVRISFAEIEYVEPDAYFPENSVVLVEGKYKNDMFLFLRVLQPPLHANKAFKFKLNDMDYFGSYIKMAENLK
jgi:DNA polymerase epsilon subunit 2